MTPGEIRTGEGWVELNAGRERRTARVTNTGDRPVQVGSHLLFTDANPALEFNRAATGGFRLDIPSGTSLRFEPGIATDVVLVEFTGRARQKCD
ncbi:urease subunit beta [Streptomyces sp. NPDC048172]|uniref:urease subunit beta n=1 Tax=Streptomyces sp. NPDC048172 TaxID=3365505 RepID=UPI00371BA473